MNPGGWGRSLLIGGVALATGCAATVSEEGVRNVPGEEIWKRQVEITPGETVFVGTEGLEIELEESTGVRAILMVKTDADAVRRKVELESGVEEFLSPYTFRLLELRPGGVTVEVRKEWGR